MRPSSIVVDGPVSNRSTSFMRSAPSILLALLLGGGLAAEVPTTVADGVSDYHLRSPKVFWHTAADCFPQPDGGPVEGWDRHEEIWRVAATGAGDARQLFDESPPRAVNVCNPYDFHSRIIADDDFVYWVEARGLVRLSTDANPGDDADLLSGEIRGTVEGAGVVELAQDDSNVYAKTFDGLAATIWRVPKSGGSRATPLHSTRLVNVRSLSSDGKYLYWIRGTTLERLESGRAVVVTTIATGVDAYWAEGSFRASPLVDPTEFVFIARGRQIVRYDNRTGQTSAPLYTSDNPEATIYSLVTTKRSLLAGGSHLFFFEARPIPAPPGSFVFSDLLLFRSGRGGGGVELLYRREESFPGGREANFLSTDQTFIFWQDADRVRRLPRDADALPEARLRVTSIEVTQGIQNLANEIPLVEDRRTMVRVHVESGLQHVQDVYAELRARDGAGDLGTLSPINQGGTRLTVFVQPDRTEMDHAFLFELPLEWTRTGLRLTAVLNPNHVPLEDTYVDNTFSIGPLDFLPSPRFEPHLVRMSYVIGNVHHTPRFEADVLQLFSYLRRQYPVASSPGFRWDPGRGLRPSYDLVFDAELGSRVTMTHPTCVLQYVAESRNKCATGYAKGRLDDWRAASENPYRVFCGMMVDPPDFFPRGSASGLVCTTPTSDDDWGWDFDGSYGDWYGAHEIGHSLGRKHPAPNSDDPDTEAREGCGHSPSDPSFPYDMALISDASKDAFGFDVGDAKTPRAVLDWSTTQEIMSYCDNYWVSDYTYIGLYTRMIALGALGGVAGGDVVEDWIFVSGSILGEGREAQFHFTRRHTTPISLVATRGEFALELVDGSGGVLDAVRFTPEPVEEGTDERAGFSAIIPCIREARGLRVVDSRGDVLAMQPLSANLPVVRSVALDAPAGVVSGIVGIEWDASDDDGDDLLVDVSWRPADGREEVPVMWSLRGPGVDVDTSELPGGAGRFRILASDGVHCGERDSDAITLADKPPVARIVTPVDGLRVAWSQLVPFEVESLDPQRQGIVAIDWRLGRRALGSGATIEVRDLPVGSNEVSVSVRSRSGATATDRVTVIVDDDLSPRGPTLSVAPSAVLWKVPEGASQAVVAVLRVSDLGPGGLGVSVADDAGWLEVDPAQGTAPFEVTLRASPAGLAPGTERLARVRFTAAAGSPSAIDVPVSLIVGSEFLTGGDPGPGEASGFRRGDPNGDGRADISDAVAVLAYLFTGGPAPVCEDAADVNDDGGVDVSDPIAELSFLFLGGAPPPAPGPASCGPDPTPDGLGACDACP